MSTYAIIYEGPSHEGGNWSAHVPDLPGCVGAADTFEECRMMMAEAVAAHVAFMRARGVPVPDPITRVEELSVAA